MEPFRGTGVPQKVLGKLLVGTPRHPTGFLEIPKGENASPISCAAEKSTVIHHEDVPRNVPMISNLYSLRLNELSGSVEIIPPSVRDRHGFQGYGFSVNWGTLHDSGPQASPIPKGTGDASGPGCA